MLREFNPVWWVERSLPLGVGGVTPSLSCKDEQGSDWQREGSFFLAKGIE